MPPIFDYTGPPATPASPQSPKLLDQVRNKIRFKYYSLRTEQAYVHWIRRFILFHNKQHSSGMGAREVEAFLTHRAVIGKGGRLDWMQFDRRATADLNLIPDVTSHLPGFSSYLYRVICA